LHGLALRRLRLRGRRKHYLRLGRQRQLGQGERDELRGKEAFLAGFRPRRGLAGSAATKKA
jgi:hypothetical protein